LIIGTLIIGKVCDYEVYKFYLIISEISKDIYSIGMVLTLFYGSDTWPLILTSVSILTR